MHGQKRLVQEFTIAARGGDIDTKIGKVGAVFEQAFDDTIFIGIVCASVKDDLHGRPLLFNSPSASLFSAGLCLIYGLFWTVKPQSGMSEAWIKRSLLQSRSRG